MSELRCMQHGPAVGISRDRPVRTNVVPSTIWSRNSCLGIYVIVAKMFIFILINFIHLQAQKCIGKYVKKVFLNIHTSKFTRWSFHKRMGVHAERATSFLVEFPKHAEVLCRDKCIFADNNFFFVFKQMWKLSLNFFTDTVLILLGSIGKILSF